MNRLLRSVVLLLAMSVVARVYCITTSLIIPCCPKHAVHLYDLLKMYEQQTELVDEVVISLSEASKVAPNIINAINEQTWKFPITLLLYEQKFYAGQNRNNACSNARGDIFICQDADDIPHPQRVEIVKHFFTHYKIMHLAHLFTELKYGITENFPVYGNVSEVPWAYRKSGRDVRGLTITNGNVIIAREVFDKIKWGSRPTGEDTDFNGQVYKNFDTCAVLKISLLAYRRYLSSGHKEIIHRRKKLDDAQVEYYVVKIIRMD